MQLRWSSACYPRVPVWWLGRKGSSQSASIRGLPQGRLQGRQEGLVPRAMGLMIMNLQWALRYWMCNTNQKWAL